MKYTGEMYSISHACGSTEMAARISQIANDLGMDISKKLMPFLIRRLRPGKHGRSAGAWSWVLVDSEGMEIVGSQHSCVEICSSKSVSLYKSEWQWTPEIIVDNVANLSSREEIQ